MSGRALEAMAKAFVKESGGNPNSLRPMNSGYSGKPLGFRFRDGSGTQVNVCFNTAHGGRVILMDSERGSRRIDVRI